MVELDNEFVSVSFVAGTRIVRAVRKGRPFVGADDMHEAWGSVGLALERLNRPDYRLLVDLRAVVGRNDPAYEQAMGAYRRRIVSGFARVAVLVETVTGRLQVERYARADRAHALRVFLSETEALQWLKG